MSQYESYPDDAPYASVWLIRIPILLFSGAVLLMLLLVIFVAVFQIQYQGRIIPNVSAYGIDLGGMTEDEAESALVNAFAQDQNRTFTFRDGEQTWEFTSAELGIRFEPSEVVRSAAAIGRGGTPIANVFDQLMVWLNGDTVIPLIAYDQTVALEKINRIAESLNRFPTDGSFQIIGTEVMITPGEIGRTVDVMTTLGRLDNAILNVSGSIIDVAIEETSPIVTNVEEAAARARLALSGPVTLIATDAQGSPLGPWTATVDQIAQLLRISTLRDESTGALRYDISVNTGAFAPYLEELARGLIVPEENGRFRFNDDTRQLELIERAQNGRTLNVAETIASMEAAIFSTSRIVPLAFDYHLPVYHDNVTAAELGITELVASGVSFYAGSSQARITNITVAAARFDGIIIAPGDIFSFNRYVGQITAEEGYVQSAVIFGDRTIQGDGGGVCQVSTTAFRAAFYGGFPIVERYAHSYRVGYYERGDPEGVGLDAAIFTPDLDFRFLNDTPYHLLIETSIYPGTSSIEFRFYSTSTGRQVVKAGPEVVDIRAALPTTYEANAEIPLGQERWVDFAAEGAYVEVTRTILDANGNQIDREIFASQYQPWGARVQVNPNDSRLG